MIGCAPNESIKPNLPLAELEAGLRALPEPPKDSLIGLIGVGPLQLRRKA